MSTSLYVTHKRAYQSYLDKDLKYFIAEHFFEYDGSLCEQATIGKCDLPTLFQIRREVLSEGDFRDKETKNAIDRLISLVEKSDKLGPIVVETIT